MSKFYLCSGQEYDTAWGWYTLNRAYPDAESAKAALDIKPANAHPESIIQRAYGRIDQRLVDWSQILTVDESGELIMVAHWEYNSETPLQWVDGEGGMG